MNIFSASMTDCMTNALHIPGSHHTANNQPDAKLRPLMAVLGQCDGAQRVGAGGPASLAVAGADSKTNTYSPGIYRHRVPV